MSCLDQTHITSEQKHVFSEQYIYIYIYIYIYMHLSLSIYIYIYTCIGVYILYPFMSTHPFVHFPNLFWLKAVLVVLVRSSMG